MCKYRHYINTEGRGQSANTYFKNNSSNIFSCIRTHANTGPTCIRAKINSSRIFSCMYRFCERVAKKRGGNVSQVGGPKTFLGRGFSPNLRYVFHPPEFSTPLGRSLIIPLEELSRPQWHGNTLGIRPPGSHPQWRALQRSDLLMIKQGDPCRTAFCHKIAFIPLKMTNVQQLTCNIDLPRFFLFFLLFCSP